MPPDELGCYVMLTKDRKPICRTQPLNAPLRLPSSWNISEIVRKTNLSFLSTLPFYFLLPAFQNSFEKKEWSTFLRFLQERDKVAIVQCKSYELYISAPNEDSNISHAIVAYQLEKAHNKNEGSISSTSVVDLLNLVKPGTSLLVDPQPDSVPPTGRVLSSSRKAAMASSCMAEEIADSFEAQLKKNIPTLSRDKHVLVSRSNKESESYHAPQARSETYKKHDLAVKHYVQTHPSYLRTLGQAHSSWIFGAIAEFVDNSRDAKATKLEIYIELIYSKPVNKDIPMLSIIDDGHGMTHQEIVTMVSFGHKPPDADDPERIGRFGIGFKTGAMRLGRDALVLTQTVNSRSIAFLSQTLNEGKDNIEIPIVSYCRKGKIMELDTEIQSKDSAKYNLKAIKEFSPFNEYLIGEKAGLFSENGTGTQIYIWNLDEWGSNCCFKWETGLNGGSSSFYQGDIFIRSGRIRSRPGQVSQKVPLDFSLRSYLEVIFLDPRMKIYVQGSLVKSVPLAKSLNRTVVENDTVMGKLVELSLGRSQLEWEQANCGIFLYWHGRLIEAYKRVGGMIHNADVGRGVIGVIDVTNLMNDGNGHVWVHNNKQGFQDCEQYAKLEVWLGTRFDEYWDKNFDPIPLNKSCAHFKPDNDWVQCNKCRKWRKLSPGFDTSTFSQEWFCFMKPYEGRCDTPEEKQGRGVVTVSTKRSGYAVQEKPLQFMKTAPTGVSSPLKMVVFSYYGSISHSFTLPEAPLPKHGRTQLILHGTSELWKVLKAGGLLDMRLKLCPVYKL